MGGGISEENGGRQNITFDTAPGQSFLVPQGQASSAILPALLCSAFLNLNILLSLKPRLQDCSTTMSTDNVLLW